MKLSTDFVAATKEFATLKNHVPAPYMRREFELSKAVKAEITICGLGLYELFINGRRITKTCLAPYISNPDDILYYDNYDLLPYLNDGKNVIGIMLGNGMLNCPGGAIWDFEKARYRSAPKTAFTFEAECENGEKLEFTAADGVKCAPSPILLDDLRAGEYYDARLEQNGWCDVDFDCTDWTDAIPAEAPRGECRITDIDPIVEVRELSPVSIKPGKISETFTKGDKQYTDFTEEEYLSYNDFSPSGDGFIYDFGVNAAGVCRIHIKNAVPGQKLVLQHAEKLSDDGGIDLRAMNYLPAAYDHRAVYICKGGDEVWSPTFTYYGFRYVLISGIDKSQATPELLTYVVMNTKLREIAEFDCSDEVANKLWRATLTSDYANFYHFPTDCPHREKNGWTADAALSAEQMLLTLTPERNYREWLNNIRKAMREDGALPGIIPTSGWGYHWGNGPAWDIALTELPYQTWKYRGNTDILRDNATAIFRYINYISTRRDERGLIHIGLGDWCPAARKGGSDFEAPLEFTDTVLCVDICQKAAKIFEVLGMNAQKQFAENIGAEFRAAARKYLINKSEMTAYGRCQATQAMAIYYDIFDDAEKPAAFERLVEIIENDGEFLYCGVLGTRVIFHVLSEFGRCDLAYKMITRPEFPSYGYMMRSNEDTALWEQHRPMEALPTSRNHHFLGDIISWFMKHLVGININPHNEDTSEIRFAPKFIDALDHASGSHIVPAGKVSAEWHRDGEDIIYTVTVPEGVRAELTLERGWQTEDGFTWRAPKGTVTYRLIHESKKDIKRLTSER